MDSKMKYTKLEAVLPADKVTKVKQIVLDKTTKKRKATGDHELSSKKKPKKPYHNAFENERQTIAGSTAPPRSISAVQLDYSSNDQGLKSFKVGVIARQAQSAERINARDDESQFSNGSEDEEVDDQTLALLEGFESDDEAEKAPKDRGYEAGQKIPDIDKTARNQAIEVVNTMAPDQPGVIYIGHIPHGFYEQEMRQYFSQFGDISKLRLSRNRRTGKSKHYAFLEFKSANVAKIVSKTMDNYLLFGHILKCKMVAPEQVHENLWVGANKRFKKVPWNKMEGRRLRQGLTEPGWAKRVEREKTRRAEKLLAMKMIDYSFVIPDLKSAKEVVKAPRQTLISTTKDQNPEDLRISKTVGVMENIVETQDIAEP